nr:hypothetical protein [Tanacetum cinerariifolium]GEX77487.1 hypothetical protein [Tanacetum cinerariifolium]GFB75704.1 hypothetical protein [Tanacetum cinerariifolium]
MVRNVDSLSKFLMYLRFLQVVINNQVDDITSHNTSYTSLALTQKVFANMRREGKGFSGVETPLFASMMVQPQPQAAKVVKRVKVPNVPTPPSHTTAPSPPLQDPTPIPHATPHASPPSPPQEQPTITSESSMSPLNTLMETSKEEGKEVGKEKEIKAFRVEEAKKGWGKIEATDVYEDITLVDVETQEEVVDMDAELQGKIDQDVSAATKDVNAAEPTVFDDEDVTMTMARTLIKLKAEKAKLLDEQMA